MPKKLTFKERIIELSRTLSPAEIADIVNSTESYVNKALRNATMSENKPPLTLQNYVAAHRQGITRKCDLARYFSVSRWTINRFENHSEIKRHFARYMELQNSGYELNKLLQHSTAILETISPFEPGSAVVSTLRNVIAELSKFDKKTN